MTRFSLLLRFQLGLIDAYSQSKNDWKLIGLFFKNFFFKSTQQRE